VVTLDLETPMATDPRSRHDDYHAFLVRVSRADAARPWETVAKDRATGEEYACPDPEALLRFLRDRLPHTGGGRGTDTPHS
jgi:hypothetical protein